MIYLSAYNYVRVMCLKEPENPSFWAFSASCWFCLLYAKMENQRQERPETKANKNPFEWRGWTFHIIKNSTFTDLWAPTLYTAWLGPSINSNSQSVMRACFISAEEIVRKINLILEELTSEAKADYSEWKEQSRGRKGSKTSNWCNRYSGLNHHKINHQVDDFCS